MNNPYHSLMSKQCLSEEAKQKFYSCCQTKKDKKSRTISFKAAAILACVLIAVPVSAFAVESIFGINTVEILKGTASPGKVETGYEISYPEVKSCPLSDISELLQTVDGYHIEPYDAWEAAERALGIELVANGFLSDAKTTKGYAYNLEKVGIAKPVHCYGTYEGKDHQLYRATVTAAYRYMRMYITLKATVTCAHPAIPKEEEYRFHWTGTIYENRDVDDISQEAYFASNGIRATIITIDRPDNQPTDYKACFATSNASYTVTVTANTQKQDAEAKAALMDIIEAFVF